MQKLSLELNLPPINEFSTENNAVLDTELEQCIAMLKGILVTYKKGGYTVPTISAKFVKKVKSKPTTNQEWNDFSKALLDHVLKYMPHTKVAPQIQAIRALFDAGFTSSEAIDLFENSRAEYALTTWLTVRYKLSKQTEVVENKGFMRREITEEEKEFIKQRVNNYTRR